MTPMCTATPARIANGFAALAVAVALTASVVAADAPAPAPSASPSPSPSPSAAASPSSAAESAHDSLAEGRDCSNCHTTAAWSIGGSGVRSGEGGFDHASTGFPLAFAHRRVTCIGCHDPARRISRECASCHADEHHGTLGATCERCHTARSFRDVRPRDIHRLTRLPLTGRHALADCTECHQRAQEHLYVDAPTQCYACHEDDYRRPDVHPPHTGSATSAPFSHECQSCHRTTTWTYATIDPTRGAPSALLRQAPEHHELLFPIRSGPHRAAPCASCHLSPEVPRAVSCIGCHEHNAVRVRAQHRSVAVSGDGAACLSCHVGGTAR